MIQQKSLIIGGAAGIGRQITYDLSARGDEVIIADMNEQLGNQLVIDLTEKGHKASFYHIDVSSWEKTQACINQIISDHKRIDVLVHSAGITQLIKFDDLNFASWKKTLQVNLSGSFYAIKAIAPTMIQQNYGKIVMIGSGSAYTGSGGGVHYATSKGGAFGLMRALVRELSHYNININIVAPRTIASEMLNKLYKTEEEFEALVKQIPLRRLGTLQDISDATVFLASKEAGFVQGQVLLCDGGRTYS
ncbi:SDR family NAD(P)-dependent oxidoreductase [Brevibacillus daliensis]|uniref:SDR family NAD(P)-dependent oxidoreductase n=1 Tax=Brevibacillus daliensis TaxID=2892995 RepID=UPI001E46D0DA|nr:SDR family oxidoreductase [Brevibacillus daliensis]